MQAVIKLNGSKTQKGNYVWGAALTLAWKNLCQQIIKEPIKVKTDKKDAQQIVQNFNRSNCSNKMLSDDCYYAKAGFGNKTAKEINEEVAKKFPNKTTEKIAQNLQDDSIISYAYFFKNLQFQLPFEKKNVRFGGQNIPGFCAKSIDMKKQVLVYEYHDQDNFLVELKTKKKDDHVLIYKTSKNLTPEQVSEHISKYQQTKQQMGLDDAFQMPKVSLKHKRDITELVGVTLANEKFSQYYFAQIYEVINLDIDQTGVKVENEGVVKLLRSGIPHVNRKFIVDKPFWIVMRERENHPYFIGYISELLDSKL